jgi:hypothetical protein
VLRLLLRPESFLRRFQRLRRRSQFRIYYVLTDAQSGKELQELPPEEVRKVGEGIAQFLKQEEAKNTSHLNVKA